MSEWVPIPAPPPPWVPVDAVPHRPPPPPPPRPPAPPVVVPRLPFPLSVMYRLGSSKPFLTYCNALGEALLASRRNP